MNPQEHKKRKSRSNSRDRLLAAASKLLREHGYSGTVLSAVADAGKAPMGSVYFHFPGGKEQLAVEALSTGGDDVSRGLVKTLSEHDDPGKAIAACAHSWARSLSESGWTEGCPIAATALQMSTSSEPIRLTAKKYFNEWKQLFQEKLITSGIEPQEALTLSDMALSILEGAELLARVTRDIEPLKNGALAVQKLIAHAQRDDT